MIASMMSVRGYLLIGVGVGFIVFMMTLLFGPEIAAWAVNFRFEAELAGQGGLGRLVLNPIIYIAENGAAGAAMAGAIWPLILVWILLIMFIFLVTIGAGVSGDATGAMIGMWV